MKAWIMAQIAKLGLKMSGIVGWVISLFLDKALAIAKDWISRLIEKMAEAARSKRQQKIDAKNVEAYNEVLADESSPTQEQIDDVTSDLLNGRRR